MGLRKDIPLQGIADFVLGFPHRHGGTVFLCNTPSGFHFDISVR